MRKVKSVKRSKTNEKSEESKESQWKLIWSVYVQNIQHTERRIGVMVDSPYKKHGEHELFVDPVLMTNLSFYYPAWIIIVTTLFFKYKNVMIEMQSDKRADEHMALKR